MFIRRQLVVRSHFNGGKTALLGRFSLECFSKFFGFLLHGFRLQQRHPTNGFTSKKLICSVSHFRLLTIDHGIGKTINMTGSLPNPWVHDDAGIEAHHVVTTTNHILPPGVFNVFTQFHPERAVIKKAI